MGFSDWKPTGFSRAEHHIAFSKGARVFFSGEYRATTNRLALPFRHGGQGADGSSNNLLQRPEGVVIVSLIALYKPRAPLPLLRRDPLPRLAGRGGEGGFEPVSLLGGHIQPVNVLGRGLCDPLEQSQRAYRVLGA